MAINLASVKKIVESFMVDVCSIDRPVMGTLNENTAQYDESKDNLYTGACMLISQGSSGDQPQVGNVKVGQYMAYLPVGVDGLKAGDLLTVLDSANDPGLVRQVFSIGDIGFDTYAAYRAVQLTHWTPEPRK